MDRLTGAGCPTHLTVGEVGQFYENTNTGDIYECRSITKDGDNVLNYAWELRVHGDHVDEHAELFGAGGSTSKYQQPEWGSETAIVELLPETELSIMSADEPMAVLQQKVTLVGGSVYTVNYNGTEYECTALESDGVVMLGNAAADGGEDTGEPFFMGFYYDTTAAETGFYGVVVPLDGSESFTLSIKDEGETIHAIPERYIEKAPAAPAAPLIVTFKIEGSLFISDYALSEIRKEIDSGRVVYVSNGDYLYVLSYVDAEQICFANALLIDKELTVTQLTFEVNAVGQTVVTYESKYFISDHGTVTE